MIKYFCDECGKEIFKGMTKSMKETTYIAEAEGDCLCSDCMLIRFQERNNK
jgi:hypothetical protein